METDHRVASDDAKAELIPVEHRCSRCGGTGNELYFMYRECVACEGSGISQGNEKDIDFIDSA